MHIGIWIVSLLVLMLWSTAVWLGYSITNFALTMPWDQATAALGQLQIPDVLKPFIDPILLIFADGSLKTWAERFGPLMQWLGSLLQGSAGWLTAALPVMAWMIWGLGAALVIALAIAGTVGIVWWKKQKKLV